MVEKNIENCDLSINVLLCTPVYHGGFCLALGIRNACSPKDECIMIKRRSPCSTKVLSTSCGKWEKGPRDMDGGHIRRRKGPILAQLPDQA